MKAIHSVLASFSLFCICFSIMFILGCQDGIVILIQLDGLPDGTQSLRIDRILNGQIRPESRYYSGSLSLGQIRLLVPREVNGILQVNIDALDLSQCVLGQGVGMIPLGSGVDTMTVHFSAITGSLCSGSDLSVVRDMSLPYQDMSLPQEDMTCVPRCPPGRCAFDGCSLFCRCGANMYCDVSGVCRIF